MATIVALNKSQFAQAGSVGRFAVKAEGLTGHATGGCAIDAIENPFGEDMLILEAYVAITTLDATDGDIDIGLADSSAAASVGAEIVDSMVHSSAVIHSYLLWTPAATGVAPPVWKAANAAHTAADSWICSYQNTSSDTSDLVYNLILVLAREADFN